MVQQPTLDKNLAKESQPVAELPENSKRFIALKNVEKQESKKNELQPIIDEAVQAIKPDELKNVIQEMEVKHGIICMNLDTEEKADMDSDLRTKALPKAIFNANVENYVTVRKDGTLSIRDIQKIHGTFGGSANRNLHVLSSHDSCERKLLKSSEKEKLSFSFRITNKPTDVKAPVGSQSKKVCSALKSKRNSSNITSFHSSEINNGIEDEVESQLVNTFENGVVTLDSVGKQKFEQKRQFEEIGRNFNINELDVKTKLSLKSKHKEPQDGPAVNPPFQATYQEVHALGYFVGIGEHYNEKKIFIFDPGGSTLMQVGAFDTTLRTRFFFKGKGL